MGVHSIPMVNGYSQTKIKIGTKEKLKQLVRLESFRLERDVSISEVLDDMMENSFQRFDDSTIKKMKKS